eukprot:3936718-Ditylum_brightwellii.AAC.1
MNHVKWDEKKKKYWVSVKFLDRTSAESTKDQVLIDLKNLDCMDEWNSCLEEKNWMSVNHQQEKTKGHCQKDSKTKDMLS